MGEQPAPVGAYGLALNGVDDAAQYLLPTQPDWPVYRLTNRVAHVDRTVDRLSGDRAELRLRSGGEILVDRLAGLAEFVTPQPLVAEELVHPYLAPVAAVAARWLGRDCLHAGAVVVDGGPLGTARRPGGR